jgi:hypothetical protein
MEINDLREFDRPRFRLWPRRAGTRAKTRLPQTTQRTKGKKPLSLCPLAVFCGQLISGFVRPLFPLAFPLQNVKEQARGRLT